MKIFGYARVSSLKQSYGQGLDYQTRDLIGYIRRVYKQEPVEGITLFKETESGTIEYLKRPILKCIYDNATLGDILVINRLDRLGRSEAVIKNAIKDFYAKGIDIVAMDFPSLKKPTKEDIEMGKDIVDGLGLGIYLNVIEYDKKNLVYRLKRGRQNARKRAEEEGKYYGEGRQRIFTSNKDDPNYEKLQQASKYAISLKNEGKTYRQISDILFEEMGVKASAGTLCREYNRHKTEIIVEMIDNMNQTESERKDILTEYLNGIISCYENYNLTIASEVIELIYIICEKEHIAIEESGVD